MTYEESMELAKQLGRTGWIFETLNEGDYRFIVSGFDHYCEIGWIPKCRVDLEVKFVHMFTGVIIT